MSTKYLKAQHREDQVMPLPLRTMARVWASSPAGTRIQREALAWLKRKCSACATWAEATANESAAHLDRMAQEAARV